MVPLRRRSQDSAFLYHPYINKSGRMCLLIVHGLIDSWHFLVLVSFSRYNGAPSSNGFKVHTFDVLQKQ